MPKIYNEIVIDMNPESSTFEETLYEDSFEYSEGDMMLAQFELEWDESNIGHRIGAGMDANIRTATVEEGKKTFYKIPDSDEEYEDWYDLPSKYQDEYRLKVTTITKYPLYKHDAAADAWINTGTYTETKKNHEQSSSNLTTDVQKKEKKIKKCHQILQHFCT